MQYLWDSQQCENVFHVFRSAGWDAGALNTFSGTFKNWWEAELKPLQAQTAVLQRIIGRDLTTQFGTAVEYTSGLPIAGSNGAPALPNSVSLAVKWGTGLAGRGFRGRTFHIGLTESQVTDNRVSTAFQTTLQAAYDSLRVTLDNATLACEFGVLSRVFNGVPRDNAILTPILGVGVDPVIDSMKRRLPGRGR